MSYATVTICLPLVVYRWNCHTSLIAVVLTVLEKSVFYGYLAVASVSLGLPTQFVHCCLETARAFMPADLIVITYTILEISKFLGQLPVDDKSQLNPSIASFRSELILSSHTRPEKET